MSYRAFWTILLLAPAACEAADPSAVTVTDSAGVTITLSRDEPRLFAEVSVEPNVSLGAPEAEGPTQFFRIQNIYVDPRDRLWIADGQSAELRIFSSDGSFLKSRGGRGEGPGEFMSIRLLGARSGDSVFVADDANGRISVFDPEGELVRTQRILSEDDPTPRLFDVFSDGSVLGQVPRMLMASDLKPGLILVDSVRLVRVKVDTQEWLPYGTGVGPSWIWTGRSQVPIPFTANAGFDLKGDELHLVSGTVPRIRVFREAHLTAMYGAARDTRPVSSGDVEAYRQLTVGYLPEERQGEYLAALDHEARPTELPAYARLLVSSDSQVWAQRYESDLSVAPVWDVFDSNHRLLGQVTTPADLIVMSITENNIVGVWRDGVGIEYVRSYSFVKQ